MSDNLNIEIKAKCNNPDKIHKTLKQLNADYRGHDHQIDTYFNCEHGRLKLRQGKIENSLIFYKRNNQVGPKESEVSLSNVMTDSSIREVLQKAYGINIEVDKKRHIYFIDNVKFHVDEVKNLGSFMEIEAIDNTETIGVEKLKKQCDYYMDILGVLEEDLIDCSYSDLLLKHKTMDL